MLVTAVKQTTTIKDNITAYSTAVGPSSLFKNRFNFMARFFIVPSDRYHRYYRKTRYKTLEGKAKFVATNFAPRGHAGRTKHVLSTAAFQLENATRRIGHE
jgi:hypothetical protein